MVLLVTWLSAQRVFCAERLRSLELVQMKSKKCVPSEGKPSYRPV